MHSLTVSCTLPVSTASASETASSCERNRFLVLWHATSVLSTPCIRFSSRPQATVGGPPSQHDDSFDAGAADDAAAGDDDDDDDDQEFVGFQRHADS